MPRIVPLSGAAKRARARARAEADGTVAPAYAVRSARKPRTPRYAMPALMVDSEGGQDEHGRHHCMLVCAADDEGNEYPFRTGRPLTTLDVMRWLTTMLPTDRLIVGYSLTYDWSMWLRDLPTKDRRKFVDGKWTAYDCYRLQMLGNRVTVCRLDVRCTWAAEEQKRQHLVGCSCRTVIVWDVVKFYQASFINAIGYDKGGWRVVTREELDVIERGKAGRGGFSVEYAASDECMTYSLAECRVGARLVARLRDAVHEALGVPLQQFFGAGSLAKLMLKNNGVAAHLGDHGWPEGTNEYTMRAVMHAYFGGRFEAANFGPVAGPIEEYDLTSAYPAQMASLPCLTHASWEHMGPREWFDRHTLLHVRWALPDDTRWGPFPWRMTDGAIICPRRGEGWYWGEEVRAARDLYPEGITVLGGLRLVTDCDCRPFDWVAGMFAWRMGRGDKNDGPGIVAKLGLNSLYGVCAQGVGSPVWQSFVWAGLITSQTRAMLLDAIARDPEAVCMVATDAVFSTRPLGLESPGLGGWERTEHPDAFVVAPGVAALGGKVKSRGLAKREFVEVAPDLIAAWQRLGPMANAKASVRRFIGLRLGLVRPDDYCQWVDSTRHITIGSGPKREHDGTGGIIPWETPYRTYAAKGPGGMSKAYDPHVLGIDAEHARSVRDEMEEQPG